MKLKDVQTHAADCIEAHAGLAAFGAALLYSPFQESEEARAEIAERLRVYGVCIKVSEIWAGSVEALRPGISSARALFEVQIAESARVAHTPARAELVTTVIEAMTATRQLTEWEIFGADDSFLEQGYVLHVIGFSIPILVP